MRLGTGAGQEISAEDSCGASLDREERRCVFERWAEDFGKGGVCSFGLGEQAEG